MKIWEMTRAEFYANPLPIDSRGRLIEVGHTVTFPTFLGSETRVVKSVGFDPSLHGDKTVGFYFNFDNTGESRPIEKWHLNHLMEITFKLPLVPNDIASVGLSSHAAVISNALEDGEAVPENILRDYPFIVVKNAERFPDMMKEIRFLRLKNPYNDHVLVYWDSQQSFVDEYVATNTFSETIINPVDIKVWEWHTKHGKFQTYETSDGIKLEQVN